MSFSGRISYTPEQLNNSTIHHTNGVRVATIVLSFPDFRQTVPTWPVSDNVPQSIASMTFGQLLTNPLTSNAISYSTTVRFSGCQQGNPQTTVTAIDQSGQNAPPITFVPSSSTCVTGSGNSGYLYNSSAVINDSYPQFGIARAMIVSNSNPAPELTYDAYNVTLQVIINITISVRCGGANLESDVCKNLCSGGNPVCLQPFATYCFPDNINESCRDYFADYIEVNGPSSTIDNGLSAYCQSKYAGFKDLFESGSQQDIDLCSCNMSQQSYTNFENELFANQPFLKQYAQQSKCLISECRNSKFISEPIPKGGCTVPNCVIINDFNNNGTFNNSTINTNVSGCGGTSPSDGFPFWVQILVAVVLIIVILLVLLSFKRQPPKRRETASRQFQSRR